jgi:hypothetical protein
MQEDSIQLESLGHNPFVRKLVDIVHYCGIVNMLVLDIVEPPAIGKHS